MVALNMGFGVGIAIDTGGGVVYEPEAAALFSRFTIPPDTDRKTLINDVWKAPGVKAVMAKMDAFFILAAADNQAARRNWIADQYNLTAVSAPTFTADRGYAGDGSTSSLSTGFDPTIAVSPKYTQNDAHMGLWSRTNLANGAANSHDMGEFNQGYIGRNQAVPGAVVGKPGSNVTINIVAGGYPGHIAWARSAASLWEGYAQGIDAGGGTDASIAPANQPLRLLTSRVLYGVNQIAAAHFGGDLTAAEMLVVKNAINTYLTAVGAA